MTAGDDGVRAADEAAAAPYVGDAPVGQKVKTLFAKQRGLQTVRGLGVSLVMFHHMSGRLVNAAAVFDAFFVISGYLISIRLIVLARTAGIKEYFLTFYTFRVRRIFPVAILTLALTAIAANLIYLPTRAHEATKDVVWALLFMANIHYAHTNTDYFQQGGVISPVLNFWSLSVEEQFYLTWPLIILIALWVANRRGRGTGVVPVAMVVIVVSFLYGWWDSATHPIPAYYSTFARAWDFGIGALMGSFAVGQAQRSSSSSGRPGSSRTVARPAELAASLHRRLRPYHELVAWTGVVLFLLAMFFTPPVAYPVPGAAFGMVGMGVIFYADTLKRDPAWLMAHARPLVWLGDISYSLYVVHVPIIVFASSYITGSTTLLYAFDVAAALCVATLMYNFVERPARQSWATTKEWFKAGGHQVGLMQAGVFGVAAVLLFVGAPRASVAPAAEQISSHGVSKAASSGPRLALPPIPDEYSRQVSPFTLKVARQLPQQVVDPNIVSPTTSLRRAISHSIALTSWPALSNEGRVDRSDFLRGCNVVDAVDPPCVAVPASGVDPAKVAVAVGDSTMLAYWPMLRDSLVPRGWTVVMYALVACPAAAVNVTEVSASPEDCAEHHARYRAVLDRWKPSVVFMSQFETTPYAISDGGHPAGVLEGARGLRAYADGLTDAITTAQGQSARVVVLSPPPLRASISGCDVAGSSPQACLTPVTGLWVGQSKLDRQVTEATGATYADLLDFFCDGVICPPIVGDTVVISDSIHLTPEYSAQLAPSFQAYLEQQGIVG